MAYVPNKIQNVVKLIQNMYKKYFEISIFHITF